VVFTGDATMPPVMSRYRNLERIVGQQEATHRVHFRGSGKI